MWLIRGSEHFLIYRNCNKYSLFKIIFTTLYPLKVRKSVSLWAVQFKMMRRVSLRIKYLRWVFELNLNKSICIFTQAKNTVRVKEVVYLYSFFFIL